MQSFLSRAASAETFRETPAALVAAPTMGQTAASILTDLRRGVYEVPALTLTRRPIQHPPPLTASLEAVMVRFWGTIALLGLVLAPSIALAQIDLSGSWGARYHEDFPERIPGPELADFLGLPINDSARQWALSWDPSRLTLPEHQCRVHVSPYIYRGPLQLRIWEDRDPRSQKLLAIKNYISTYEQTRTIWMDGRPHPPEYAAHTWEGFSTGKWEGDMLTVETTHIKQGWVRRNGLPESDRATLIEHFIRHDEYLTHISVLTDPVYLTEPLVKSQNFVLNQRQLPDNAWVWPCQIVDEVVGRPAGAVPHYLPGQNPFVSEFVTRSGIPIEATMGGAETMYPEYLLKLQQASSAKTKPQ